ncbi:DNA-binding protein [Salmonella enterica subsp. enterica]|nr:DNA-binding protein [Salmonella enterica subsp. enterica]
MMGSREIAELTGKEHKIVVRDIKTLLEQLGFHSTEMYHDENKDFFIKMKVYNGRDVIDEILLDQDLSTTLVTGYSARDRYKVVKRWRELETGRVQPLVTHQPAQPAPAIQVNEGIVQIARVIAEATASATMKAMAEVITLPSYPTETAAPVYARQPEGEYVPVSKAAWETGLSDSACRKLIGFFKVPVRSNGGLRGLLVNLPEMKKAAERLLRESTAPEGKRKRWSHPQFGNFTCYADLI